MTERQMYAESALIACVLRSSEAFERIRGRVTEADWPEAWQQDVWRAVAARCDDGQSYDVVDIAESVGDFAAAQAMHDMEGYYSLDRVEDYAEHVAKHAVARRAITLAEEMRERLESGDDPGEILADVSLQIEALQGRPHGEGLTFAEVIAQASAASKAAMSRGGIGINLSLPTLSKRLGGWQAGRLYVVAARPSVGKTALTLQEAIYAAMHSHPVGICSLEMTVEELGMRSQAHCYSLNGTALALGEPEFVAKLEQAQREKPIADLPMWIDTEIFSLDGIVARITEWHRAHKVELVIVDHIGLVEVPGKDDSPNNRLGKVSRTLKKVAKKLNIAVIAVSQLNRNVEREGRWPVLSDLRDSGSIEQDCDAALFIHAETHEASPNMMPLKLGLLKNRSGRKGWIGKQYGFYGATQTITELADWQPEDDE